MGILENLVAKISEISQSLSLAHAKLDTLRPPLAEPSPDGTELPPSQEIVDGQGNVWWLANAQKLRLVDGVVHRIHADGRIDRWTGSGWELVEAPTPPPPPPPPQPPFQVIWTPGSLDFTEGLAAELSSLYQANRTAVALAPLISLPGVTVALLVNENKVVVTYDGALQLGPSVEMDIDLIES